MDVFPEVQNVTPLKEKKASLDFPGGPVAKTPSSLQGAWVRSLVRELDPTWHN